MPYADYTYYTETYKGTMPEEDFNRLSRRASAYIAARTFGRSDRSDLSADFQGKIKDACCAVSDAMLERDSGGELVSQSVGSWSKSFAPSGKTSNQKIYEAAALYLAATGLMYQGGGG